MTLTAGSGSIGKTLGAFALHASGVQVMSVRKGGGAVVRGDDAMVLGAGDTLVLAGLPESLALAEAKLLRGS